jgi:hypothetical protein
MKPVNTLRRLIRCIHSRKLPFKLLASPVSVIVRSRCTTRRELRH